MFSANFVTAYDPPINGWGAQELEQDALNVSLAVGNKGEAMREAVLMSVAAGHDYTPFYFVGIPTVYVPSAPVELSYGDPPA
jgi:hypothetical protein